MMTLQLGMIGGKARKLNRIQHMDLKQTARRFLPPILIDWYRTIKYGRQYQGYVWEGVYQKYRDVPVRGAGYEGDRLVQETFAYTKSVLAASRRASFIPTDVTGQHVFLPMLVSTFQRDEVRILDFGGGMGVDYIHLTSSVPDLKHIDYHIVENSSMCKLGSHLFEDDPQVHFHSSLPTDLATVDIIYICTALQYIEDYPALLKDLCNYHPEYFLFVKLAAGEIPTYVSSQRNLRNAVVGHWFINIKEIESLMSSNGYILIYKSALEREYNQENFPAKYRLKRHCNLLFRRLTD